MEREGKEGKRSGEGERGSSIREIIEKGREGVTAWDRERKREGGCQEIQKGMEIDRKEWEREGARASGGDRDREREKKEIIYVSNPQCCMLTMLKL